MLMKLALSCFF